MSVPTTIEELDLTDPDLIRVGGGPPLDYFARLRSHDPVHWNPPPADPTITDPPTTEGYWVLTRHADVLDVSHRPERFSSAAGGPQLGDMDGLAEHQLFLDGLRQTILGMDPPDHITYRRIVSKGFTPRAVRALEARIREMSMRVVDRVAGAGACDFVADVAARLPLAVICELLGVPEEDHDRVLAWSNATSGVDDPELSTSREARDLAMGEVFAYAHALAADKVARPDGTLVSQLVNADVNGERLTELEFDFFFLLLMNAGNETSRNATAHAVRLLSEHPDQRALLLADLPGRISGAVHEVLRFSPPLTHFRRTATQDASIAGHRIRAGDKVYLSYASANRDEAVFDEPDRFDITRDPNAHLAFGHGEHVCLGAHLATLQVGCILEAVLTRLPDITVSGSPEWVRSNFFNALKRLPVSYTPVP